MKHIPYFDLFQTGKTPLHVAASRGHDDVVSLLLQKGADLNTIDQVRNL